MSLSIYQTKDLREKYLVKGQVFDSMDALVKFLRERGSSESAIERYLTIQTQNGGTHVNKKNAVAKILKFRDVSKYRAEKELTE